VRDRHLRKILAIYKEDGGAGGRPDPGASQWQFDGVGHCVAQEAPGRVLEAIEAFEAGDNSHVAPRSKDRIDAILPDRRARLHAGYLCRNTLSYKSACLSN